MAFGYKSIQSTAWATASSVIVTKPTVVVGDLLVAHIAGITLNNIAAPSGWTLDDTRTNGALGLTANIYHKIADSSDVAATNYTWTFDSTPCSGSMIAISEPSNVNTVTANGSGGVDNTANPTWAITITPDAVGGNLLIIFATADQNNNAIGGYAIATSNPTWTEVLDTTANVGGTDYSTSIAYAIRTQTTATGNVSVTGGDTTSDWVGQIISVKPGWYITVNETATLTESAKQNISILTQETLTLTEEVEAEKLMWANQTKNSSTWVNLDKTQ